MKKPIRIAPYDESETDRLLRLLQLEQSKGKATYYQIMFDQERVISKTGDLNEFLKYRDFLHDNVKAIRILVFEGQTGNSCKNKEYLYYFGDSYSVDSGIDTDGSGKKEGNEQPLQGIPTGEDRTRELIEQAREQWERSLIEKELTQTKEALKEAEDYIKQLEGVVEESKESVDWSGMFSVLGTAIKQNPEILDRGLAGIFRQDGNKRTHQEEDHPVGEASFKRKQEPAQVSEEQANRYFALFHAIEQRFKQNDTDLIMQILKSFIQKPEDIYKVAGLLDIPFEHPENHK